MELNSEDRMGRQQQGAPEPSTRCSFFNSSGIKRLLKVWSNSFMLQCTCNDTLSFNSHDCHVLSGYDNQLIVFKTTFL